MLAAMPGAMIGACVMLSCTWLNASGWRTERFSSSTWPGVWFETPKLRTLPAAVQRVEGRGDLIRLDQRVGAVQQQHVEVVGAQRRERLVDRLRRMCSFEKSKKPSRMPTLDWMMTDSRSAGLNVTASPKRSSHP